jgi:hypothetical protein
MIVSEPHLFPELCGLVPHRRFLDEPDVLIGITVTPGPEGSSGLESLVLCFLVSRMHFPA